MALRSKSAAAAHLEELGSELRLSQARARVFPHVLELRRRNAGATGAKAAAVTATGGGEGISKKELQQLACYFRLNRMPGFWSKNSTLDALLMTLDRHVEALSEEAVSPSPEALEAPSAPGAGAWLAATRSSLAPASPGELSSTLPAQPPLADAGADSMFMVTPRDAQAQASSGGEHSEAWEASVAGMLPTQAQAESRVSRIVQRFTPSLPARGAKAGLLVYASRMPSGSMSAGAHFNRRSVPLLQGEGAPGSPSGADGGGLGDGAGVAASLAGSAEGPEAGAEEKEGDAAFQALRMSSTGTLVRLARDPAMRPRIAAGTTPRTLFATWHMAGSEAWQSTSPATPQAAAIRRNTAVVLTYLFLSEQIPHDDMLLPVLTLCAPGSGAAGGEVPPAPHRIRPPPTRPATSAQQRCVPWLAVCCRIPRSAHWTRCSCLASSRP